MLIRRHLVPAPVCRATTPRALLVALAIGGLSAAAPRAHAQTAFAEASARTIAPIETDRPDFIESSVVVPRGFWQLENGFTYARTGSLSTISGSESLLRFGAFDRVELRLGLPNVEWERGPGAIAAGHGDAYAGIKWQIGPLRDWEMAVIPGISLPVGAQGRTSGTWDPELKVTFARDLGSGFDVSGMVSGTLASESGERVSVLEPALAIGRELAPSVRLFVEWVGGFQQRRETGHLAHAGVAWTVTEHVLLDVHAGRRVAGDFPDGFIAFGVSFRRGPDPKR